MKRDELIDEVLGEMDRVWNGDFGGESVEYEWLLENFNVTEEDDVQWQLIIQHSTNNLPEEELKDEELMAFLEDDGAVVDFLEKLVKKYRSSSASYFSTLP
ncbi:hypothetical protein D3C78_759490 [compost metagenome]